MIYIYIDIYMTGHSWKTSMTCWVKTAFQSIGVENCSYRRSPKDGGHASKNLWVVTAKIAKS